MTAPEVALHDLGCRPRRHLPSRQSGSTNVHVASRVGSMLDAGVFRSISPLRGQSWHSNVNDGDARLCVPKLHRGTVGDQDRTHEAETQSNADPNVSQVPRSASRSTDLRALPEHAR
jgi:hypothetical protein